jgi:hypothetical protein
MPVVATISNILLSLLLLLLLHLHNGSVITGERDICALFVQACGGQCTGFCSCMCTTVHTAVTGRKRHCFCTGGKQLLAMHRCCPGQGSNQQHSSESINLTATLHCSPLILPHLVLLMLQVLSLMQ